MPLDPTNMPFQRQPAIRGPDDALAATLRGATQQQTAVRPQPRPDTASALGLRAESILLEEFNRAGVVAYQAKDELTALFNLYLITIGALATGMGVLANTYTSKNAVTVLLVEVLLLAIATILSFAFYVRRFDIAREYRESLLAMGRIKEYYIKHLAQRAPDLAGAFHQRLTTTSLRRPLGAGTSIMTVTIALLGGLGAAGAVGQARQLIAISTRAIAHYTPEITIGPVGIWYAWEILAGLITIAIHLIYFLATHRHSST